MMTDIPLKWMRNAEACGMWELFWKKESKGERKRKGEISFLSFLTNPSFLLSFLLTFLHLTSSTHYLLSFFPLLPFSFILLPFLLLPSSCCPLFYSTIIPSFALLSFLLLSSFCFPTGILPPWYHSFLFSHHRPSFFYPLFITFLSLYLLSASSLCHFIAHTLVV